MLEADEKQKNHTKSTKRPIKAQSKQEMPQIQQGNELAYQQQQRIVQPNLVYIINIHQSLADEKVTSNQILSQKSYFGQYGEIKKCKVKKHKPLHKNGLYAFSAHITYKSAVYAAQCIQATDGFNLCGLNLSVTFGTTKYCNHFLQKGKCPRKSCPFLHKFCSEQDTMSKDKVTQFHFMTPSNFKVNQQEFIVIPPDNKKSFLPSIVTKFKRANSLQLTQSPKVQMKNRRNSDVQLSKHRWGFTFKEDADGAQIDIYELFRQKLFNGRLCIFGQKLREIITEDSWMEELLCVLYKRTPIDVKDIKKGDFDDCCLELRRQSAN